MCERLTAGAYVGVDRSATMVRASEQRNRHHVASGRARFMCASLLDADLGDARFDRALAVRVVAMTQLPELARTAALLAPEGMVLLALDSPDDARTRHLVDVATDNLAAAGFGPPRRDTTEVEGHALVCLTATAPARPRRAPRARQDHAGRPSP